MLQSYLYRLSRQLQWAFDTVESRPETVTLQRETPKSASSPDPRETFAGLKQLIIKSADIVDAYSETIEKKLAGSYAAQSEFGSFQEKTAQQLTLDSEKLQQLFSHTRELSGTLESLKTRAEVTDAYLRTGCLQKDPVPVYGIEVGQKTTVDGQPVFDKFARFTADRLSFFDRSDVEVAYISDYKLYISNAHVTGTLDLGSRFRVLFENGLAFQWTGGKS